MLFGVPSFDANDENYNNINIVISKLLNNIIELGREDFRYTFSFKSNGDMIVDTHFLPISDERRFYGLTKNGKFIFKDTNNQLTGFYSKSMDHSNGRIEGESYCIKLTSSNTKFHGRELILGISKNANDAQGYFTKIYNLDNNNLQNI